MILFCGFFQNARRGRGDRARGDGAPRTGLVKKACAPGGKKAEKGLDFPRVYGMIEIGN